jgi:acetyl esterase
MPLDPQAEMVLEISAALGFPPNHTVSPEQARANYRARARPRGPEVAQAVDQSIPGPDVPVPVRIYTPQGRGPFPALVWCHGGGWVVGDLDGADATARHLTVGANCVVVSVDYRLAPDAKFPGPLEDCYAVTRWVASNAAGLNVAPGQIAVGGDSAGGNLAAAVAMLARDRGVAAPVFQLLVYPATNRDFGTASYRDNAEGYQLTRDTMIWYWNHYLRNDADAANPYAAPLQATDLRNLPPALVITAEYDPLRDDGEAYARRLEQAGIPTVCTRYQGMIHGFFGMSAAIDQGKQAIDQASRALREAFAASVVSGG